MQYAGRNLTPNPVRMTLEDTAHALKLGDTIEVRLEPGDATRYDFVLSFVRSWNGERYLSVIRTNGGVGGGVLSCALLLDPETTDEHYLSEEYSRLANGNEWSYEIFRWWFPILWALV